VLLVVALVTSLLAAAPVIGATDDAGDYGNGYMIVEFSSSPLAHNDAAKVSGRFDPSSRAYANALRRLEQEHSRFLDRLAKTAPEAEVVNEMFATSNSVVVKLNGSSPTSIESIAGVQRTSSSEIITLDMDQSVGLIGAPGFWADVNGAQNAGAGIDVAIIDAGIDSTHEFFKCKEIGFGGIYYSGVGIAPQIPAIPAIFGPGWIPGPGDPLYFSSSHGTHVAGTVAGCETTIEDGSVWDGTTLSGVAPGANLWDYNVFPSFGAGYVAFGGSAFSHDIAAAIEDAVLDDMEVINMSLGGGVQGPHDFLAEVSNAAVAAGVTVVTSAGNEGPGLYTVGSPGSAEDVIAVGASTNTRGMAVQIITSSATYKAVPGEFPDFDGSEYDVVDWGGTDNQACSSAGAPTYSGEVVIISRGSCSFSQKVANANAAGAGGVIVYNNIPGADPIGMAGTPGFDDDIPAVMVSYEDGGALEADAPLSATVTPPVVVPEISDLLAGFSSRGPAPFTYVVKPDVVAPGVNILSSVLTFNLLGKTGEGWELYNGTSMASPHVAGAAAALLGANPGWGPTEVKSALVTTANAAKPGLSVFEQGGGLVDMVAAAAASTFFSPANASFGVTKGNKPASGSIDIAIDGSEACSVTGTTGDYVEASVSVDTLTVDFNGGRNATTGFYGGYVNITCGSGDYHIPWGAVVLR
jgi:minor extracellular serine protease Vpr